MNKQTERIRIKDIARLAGVSVGTVDRVLHARSGVSETSKRKVDEILKRLDYQPNMYASILASNKRYTFACLLPLHGDGDYWVDVEKGMEQAMKAFSDFNVSLIVGYYDQYERGAFVEAANGLMEQEPDGMVMSPTVEAETECVVGRLSERNIPYIFIDSNIPRLAPLTFYGQHAKQSGCFAARMMSLMLGNRKELVIFRQIYDGRLGSNQQLNREAGFRAYMESRHPDISLLEVNLYAKQPDEDRSVLDAFFHAHPEVRYGITFNSKAYIIGEYMQKNHIRDFKLTGYDLLPRNVACLKAGNIDFIIAQQPNMQGYNSIESLCNALILKKNVKECNYMPITLLSVENIDFYLDTHDTTDSQLHETR